MLQLLVVKRSEEPVPLISVCTYEIILLTLEVVFANLLPFFYLDFKLRVCTMYKVSAPQTPPFTTVLCLSPFHEYKATNKKLSSFRWSFSSWIEIERKVGEGYLCIGYSRVTNHKAPRYFPYRENTITQKLANVPGSLCRTNSLMEFSSVGFSKFSKKRKAPWIQRKPVYLSTNQRTLHPKRSRSDSLKLVCPGNFKLEYSCLISCREATG